jgi:hypothetical protein
MFDGAKQRVEGMGGVKGMRRRREEAYREEVGSEHGNREADDEEEGDDEGDADEVSCDGRSLLLIVWG